MTNPQKPGGAKRVKQEFLLQMGNGGNMERLFDQLDNIAFWIKDRQRRYVMANPAVLKLCRLKKWDEIIGKKDSDFFPEEMSKKVAKDDNAILAGKRIIQNRLEIVHDERGLINWHSTNKVPLYGKNGEIIGVAGTTRKAKTDQILDNSGSELSGPMRYIYDNYSKSINIKELAKKSGFSVSQFVKKFNSILQISPAKFIISIRVREACKLLIATSASLSDVSQMTGFYDHSSFNRQFKSYIGMIPSQYRRKYSK